MGKWYGPGGDQSEGRAGGTRYDPGVRPPCPNGVLLSDAEAPYKGTKMTDSMGRVWGCPGTSINKDTETTTGNEQTSPLAGDSGSTTDPSKVWSMSPELNSLYGSLMGRANELLGMPLGYDQKAKDAMFGQGFEAIRGNQATTGNTIMHQLNRLGMGDSGAALGMLGQNAWGAQNDISGLMRDLYVKDQEQRKQDLFNSSQMANSLFGTSLGAEQLAEMLNAARRGEASDFWNKLLAYLSIARG